MSLSFLTKELYNQKLAVNHSHNIAGSNFRSLSNIPHCWPKISLDLVSVPVWLDVL